MVLIRQYHFVVNKKSHTSLMYTGVALFPSSEGEWVTRYQSDSSPWRWQSPRWAGQWHRRPYPGSRSEKASEAQQEPCRRCQRCCLHHFPRPRCGAQASPVLQARELPRLRPPAPRRRAACAGPRQPRTPEAAPRSTSPSWRGTEPRRRWWWDRRRRTADGCRRSRPA